MEDQDFEDDFVLSDGPGFRAALCSKCGAIKPVAEFQRRMSKAYAQSRGKVEGVGMVVESSMCRSCQPKPKPIEQLTAKELHNKVQTGDVHALVSARILEERKARATAAIKTAVQTAWNSTRAKQWDNMLVFVRAELRRVQQQEKYAKKNCPDLDLTFFLEYKVLLGMTRYRITHEQRTTSGKAGSQPKSGSWQAYVSPEDWHKIAKLWEAMPLTYRTGAKPPRLLEIHPEDARPYTTDNKTLRKGPTPAERLGLKGEKP